jgi:hypothetical protein
MSADMTGAGGQLESSTAPPSDAVRAIGRVLPNADVRLQGVGQKNWNGMKGHHRQLGGEFHDRSREGNSRGRIAANVANLPELFKQGSARFDSSAG